MTDHVNNFKYLKTARRSLRNNLTREERILWSVLKNNKWGYKFRRQHSIGRFVADFYCPMKKLIIEVDGGQYLDEKEYDKERTEYLESLEIKVIRFWNREIREDLNRVLAKIESELRT